MKNHVPSECRPQSKIARLTLVAQAIKNSAPGFRKAGHPSLGSRNAAQSLKAWPRAKPSSIDSSPKLAD